LRITLMKYWRLQINSGIEAITDVAIPVQYHMPCVIQFVMLLILLMLLMLLLMLMLLIALTLVVLDLV
jgi:hypothetical protein